MRPDWDTYFLQIADVISRRSPDPSTKHGCVLVDVNNRIISTGYNGPVQGIDHSLIPFDKRPDKYDWMIHAEDNAVAFAKCDLIDTTAYITGPPCAPCFRRLLQAGVIRIVHSGRGYHSFDEHEQEACQIMASAKGVQVIEKVISTSSMD